jgi:ribonuclease E
MVKKMLINAQDPEEIRVALVEDGRLEGFYVETAAREQTRGNIYKAVVANMEPSLQAAFLDYGTPRHGFLQMGDVRPELMGGSPEGGPPPAQALKKGQELVVQVVKEPTGNKGASLTTYISLPGQALVLTVGRHNQGISRRIEADAERSRLKEVLQEAKLGEELGIIARTASEGRAKKEVLAEVRMLQRLWEDIAKRAKKAKAPALLHKEQELAVRTVRDLFTSDVSEILVDHPEVHSRLERFVGLVNPRRKKAVKLYREKRPIFARYDIERQLQDVYRPAVGLPSGGGIVVHPTEALVAVDVNSGKAVSGGKLEETALAVNLEAAAEVARQLRLRDLGGLVVIDFIDMRERKHQRQVVKKLKDELKKDKAKVTVGAMSRFGLVELSRQRIRPPVDYGSTQACPHCQGRGLLRTPEAVGRGVLRTLERKLVRGGEGGLRVVLPPAAHHYLANAKRAELARLEAKSGVCLELRPDPELGAEEVRYEKAEADWPLPLAPETDQAPPPPPAPAPEPEPAEAADQPAPKKRSRRRRSGRRRRSKKSNSAAGGQAAE